MPAYIRWSVQVLFLAGVVTSAADAPYLPSAGPPALRFASPPLKHPSPVFYLPPIVTIEPRPVPETQLAAPPIPALPDEILQASPATPLPIPSPSFAVPMDPVVSNGVEVARPDTENLTPQMFMNFFSGRPGTNTPGLSIISPVPFVPPAPPAPSSTATYQTTPPAKP